MTDTQNPGTQNGPKPAQNKSPNGWKILPSSRRLTIRQVLLEWLEVQAPDVPVGEVDALVRQVSSALAGGSVRAETRSSWRLKSGATPDDARRLAARMEATWPGGERR
jgi:hypothetical protein